MRQQLDSVSLAQKLVWVAQLSRTGGSICQAAGQVFGNHEKYRRGTTLEQKQWVKSVKKGAECKIEEVPEYKEPAEKNVRIEIYLSPSRHARFKQLCAQSKRNMNRYTNQLIAEELQKKGEL